MSKLIGIVGYAGSGKTSVTRAACEAWDGFTNVKQIGFADPLYKMLEAMGVPSAILYNKSRWNEAVPILNGHSLRFAMTTLGTEWGREHLGIDVWTNLAIERVKQYHASGFHVIVDNCRFPSEFDALEKAGACMIAMHRNDLEIDKTHSSEQYIEELQARCPFSVYNHGTFQEGAFFMRGILREITR